MKYFSKKFTMRAVALTSTMMLALPAFAQVDGTQANTHKHAEFLSNSGFAVENCDALAEPAELKEVIDLAAAKLSKNAIVCVLPGATEATLTLKHEGLRLIALQPGLTSLNGATYLSAPTVLVGFSIGSLAIDKSAAGSVVALSKIGKAITMTSNVVFIGNSHQKGIEGPVGRMSVGLHLPSYARGLSLGRNLVPLSASQSGDKTVAGWLSRNGFASNTDASDTNSATRSIGQATSEGKTVNQPSAGSLDTAINWFAQTKLVSHTSPNREGETLKRGQDVPVYRNPSASDKPISGMIFVPFHAGLQPDLNRIGIILGLN